MAEHISAVTTTVYTASADLKTFISELIQGIPAPPGREGTPIQITDEVMAQCTLAFATPSIKQLLGKPAKTNKMLEFVGDAAIELAVTHWLSKTFPDEDVGRLTWRRQCVVGNDKGLMDWGRELDLEKYIGLEIEGKKTLPSVLEAIVGAIYNHLGFDYVLSFVTSYLDKQANDMFVSYLPTPLLDELSVPTTKSSAFETLGKDPNMSVTPNYRGHLEEYLFRRGFPREDVVFATRNEGTDNNLAWVTSVTAPCGAEDKIIKEVSRSSKKAGIAEASRQVLEELKRMEAEGFMVRKNPTAVANVSLVDRASSIPSANYKGLLQNLLYKRYSVNTQPNFVSLPSGLPHDYSFTCTGSITIENHQFEATGEGKKKIDAEQVAAKGLHDQLVSRLA